MSDEFLTVRSLTVADATVVARMLQAQPPAYVRFFYAFEFTTTALEEILRRRRRDVYTGLFWHGKLIGLFMLRGWDDGYDVPAFGVLIADEYRGGTLLRLTLDMAKFIARRAGATRMMAKIHPDNISERGARRLGWHSAGNEPETGNIIYYMGL